MTDMLEQCNPARRLRSASGAQAKYLIYTAATQLRIKSALWSDILSGDGVLKRI